LKDLDKDYDEERRDENVKGEKKRQKVDVCVR